MQEGRRSGSRLEFGKVPSLDQLKSAMESAGKFKALYLVHNETSTGVTAPYVEEASKLARDHGAFAVIDAISSLGGYAIPVDRWGVDMCITGSQKCIAAPPGLALLSVSQRVVGLPEDVTPQDEVLRDPEVHGVRRQRRDTLHPCAPSLSTPSTRR